jgi:hypothetical protein
MSNSISGEILSALSIAAFALWCADIPPFGSQEVTTYRAACYSAEGCKPAEYELQRFVYRPDISNRTVTWWSKDAGDEVFLYKDCAIRDKKNWKCQVDDNAALWKASMSDGKVNTAIEVPWYRWWSLRFERM